MRPSRVSTALAAVVLLPATAACSGSPVPGRPSPVPSSGAASTSGSPATGSPTGTSPSTRSSASSGAPTTRPAPGPAAVAGPVWPIGVRTLAPGAGPGLAVLRQIRTGRHGSFERVVLEFGAAFGAVSVRYVPVVRADPSDRVVALRGRSFLQIVVRSAAATYAATPITPYAGPATVLPGYRTVQQVSISGDFEAVLAIGVGLSRTAGFRVQRLTAPERLVLDVAEPPDWRLWPEDSRAQAAAEQAAVDAGHQAWRLDPARVADAYARAVYGWPSPVVTRVPGTPGYTYRISESGSSDGVTVRAVPVFARAHSIFAIADTR